MDSFYIEKSIPEHAFILAKHLKPLARFEIATMGNDPLSSLLSPFRVNRPNTHTFTLFEKDTDKIIAMFGTVPVSKTNPSTASIWFLSSNLLDKHKKIFLKRNHDWLIFLESHHRYVYNFIIPEHKLSIKWLKWQKFCFAQKPVLVNGVKMYYFYKQLPDRQVMLQPIYREIGPTWRTELTKSGQLCKL